MTQVALIHEGELNDVRDALEELGVETVELGKEDTLGLVQSAPLLVTTPNNVGNVARRPLAGLADARNRARWIVVSEQLSRSARRTVLNAGFDTIIERPVRGVVLAAVLREALFRGDDRRARRRVVVGGEVVIRAGRNTQEALLVDVCPLGCRLLTNDPVGALSQITIQFPKDMADRGFAHEGLVVRSVRKHGREIGFDLGVRFDPFSDADRASMLVLLNSHSRGPRPSSDMGSEPAVPADPNLRAPRGVFSQNVGISGISGFALEGIDLSAGGVRVAPHDALQSGARLKLELGCGTDGAMSVDAEVHRLDGEQGTFLRFEWADMEARESLTEFVESLEPVVPRLPMPGDEEDEVPTLTDTLTGLINRLKG